MSLLNSSLVTSARASSLQQINSNWGDPIKSSIQIYISRCTYIYLDKMKLLTNTQNSLWKTCLSPYKWNKLKYLFKLFTRTLLSWCGYYRYYTPAIWLTAWNYRRIYFIQDCGGYIYYKSNLWPKCFRHKRIWQDNNY